MQSHLIDAAPLIEAFAETDDRMPRVVFALLGHFLTQGPFAFDAAAIAAGLNQTELKTRVNPQEIASLQPDIERFFETRDGLMYPRKGVLALVARAGRAEGAGMSEGEVVDRLVEFTSILLGGVSVFFTVVSAYIAALNYFIHRASLLARLAAFLFMLFTIGLLLVVLYGAQRLHAGLIARLRELEAEGALTAAGRAALDNSGGVIGWGGYALSVDAAVLHALLGGTGLTIIALFVLTFLFRWRDDPA